MSAESSTSKLCDESCLLHLTQPDANTLLEVGRLRIIAWEASGPRPKMAPKVGDTWTDSHDDHAHHWIVREQGRIVAAARMCVHSAFSDLPDCEDLVACKDSFHFPVASINRLVIHPERRRNGLSRLFDLARLRLAEELGAKCVVGCTQPESRIQSLGELGFNAVGEAPKRVVPYAPTIVLLKFLE